MLDFEDVIPRKKGSEEIQEEVVETVSEDVVEEVQAVESSAEEEQEMPEEQDETEQDEDVNPSPSVREYHYEEQVKKAPKKKKGWVKFIVGCLVIG
ncbi:MAG: hypothetical protein IKY38_03715, partial [Anaerotignum sp.]|nr:hypothetical protein [Anaerotignum sp.]